MSDSLNRSEGKNMKIERFVLGPIETNCYVVVNEDTKECFAVDMAYCPQEYVDHIREQGYQMKALFLTHGHFDHAGGAAEVAAHFGIKVYAEEHERETLDDPKLNLSGWAGAETTYRADVFLKDEQEFDLAGFHIRVLFTPGHTVGGCCYYFAYQDALFSGDTLFAQSVGRTDFPKGSASALIRGIKEKLLPLPDEVTVYTGHNDTTTIGTERRYNPYL